MYQLNLNFLMNLKYHLFQKNPKTHLSLKNRLNLNYH